MQFHGHKHGIPKGIELGVISESSATHDGAFKFNSNSKVFEFELNLNFVSSNKIKATNATSNVASRLQNCTYLIVICRMYKIRQSRCLVM